MSQSSNMITLLLAQSQFIYLADPDSLLYRTAERQPHIYTLYLLSASTGPDQTYRRDQSRQFPTNQDEKDALKSSFRNAIHPLRLYICIVLLDSPSLAMEGLSFAIVSDIFKDCLERYRSEDFQSCLQSLSRVDCTVRNTLSTLDMSDMARFPFGSVCLTTCSSGNGASDSVERDGDCECQCRSQAPTFLPRSTMLLNQTCRGAVRIGCLPASVWMLIFVLELGPELGLEDGDPTGDLYMYKMIFRAIASNNNGSNHTITFLQRRSVNN
ncbi:hypothetical protein EV426DRAFT_641142 [Tirmania nivea]|nr:hypothetical protein EV426DRAFT_641142 [Tirmania nivea]